MVRSTVRAVWNNPVVRAFRAAPSSLAGAVIVLVLVVIAILAPPLLAERAETQSFDRVLQNPSSDFLLGTDQLGRDIFSQLLVATRLSLGIALASATIALLVGLLLGGASAVLRGRARNALLRTIDTLISFPALLITIFFAVIFGTGVTGVLFGVGLAFSFPFARLVSTLAMSVGGREYINAARVVGVGRGRLLWRYILANIAEPLIIAFSVMIAGAILAVSALSFLGLGVQAPSYDWGRLLSEGLPQIYQTPAAAFGPAVFIVLAAVGFGMTGEALARALNPLLWTTKRPSSKLRIKRRRSAGDAQAPAPTGAAGAGPESANGESVRAALDDEREVVLDVRELTVTFPGTDGPVEVVQDVTFSVRRGEFVGIVGESGSGKSMTMLSVAQLTPFPGKVTGDVVIHGENPHLLSKRRLNQLLGTRMAVVFQDPMSSLNPALRIETQLTEGVRIHRGLSRSQANDKAVSGLSEMHIPAARRQLRRYSQEFSGGMRQRVMIAKGLMREPSVLIADEPTTALDVTVQAQIMEVLHEINREHNTAVVFISHNLALISQNCERVIVMYAGRIVEEMKANDLVQGPLHPYTQALLRAVPSFEDERDGAPEPIPGEIPSPSAGNHGCSYAMRCPLAQGRCEQEVPLLRTRPDQPERRVACHVVNADVS